MAREIGYRQLTQQLVGQSDLDEYDEAHLALRRVLYGESSSTANPRLREWLGLLDDFVSREGHARVPQDHIERGYRLGARVVRWRSQYKSGALPADSIDAIESRTGWVWDWSAFKLELSLAALDSYVGTTGHARVPATHVEGEVNLGRVVNVWRSTHKSGSLDHRTVSLLESRPAWTWDARHSVLAGNLIALDSFVEAHQHSRVAQSHIENGVNLGVLVSFWRAKHKRGTLSAEMTTALEARDGWVWDARRSTLQSNLTALDAFVAANGHARVPLSHVEGGVRLGKVVSKWRARVRSGSAPADLIAALESRPGWVWSARSAS